jgi:hypothetical protein
MLHAKSLLDGFLQELVFSHGHMGKITNESPNRKLKNPGQTIVGKLAEFVS